MACGNSATNMSVHTMISIKLERTCFSGDRLPEFLWLDLEGSEYLLATRSD